LVTLNNLFLMRVQIIVLFIFFPFLIFSQDVFMLKINAIDSRTNNPITYKDVVLYYNFKVLDNSFIDEKGGFAFVLDTVPFNTDSVYFYIKTEDTLSSNTKIFINKLNLLEDNNITNFNIRITDFRYLTTEEYTKYCKENGVMPRRKKTLAKDVE